MVIYDETWAQRTWKLVCRQVCVHTQTFYMRTRVFFIRTSFVCVCVCKPTRFVWRQVYFVCRGGGWGGELAWWVRVCSHTHRFSMKTNGFCVYVCVRACVHPDVFMKTSAYYFKTNVFCVCVCARASTPTVLRSVCSEAHPKGSTQKFTLRWSNKI